MNIVNTRGFVKTGDVPSNNINWYYMKNTDNLNNYRSFLEPSKRDLIQLFKSLSATHPIKYNLKLEATYDRPNVDTVSTRYRRLYSFQRRNADSVTSYPTVGGF